MNRLIDDIALGNEKRALPQMNTDWLAERARISPQKLALISGSERWSYDDLNGLVESMAGNLAPILNPGDRAAVLLPNCMAAVVLIHALARIGAVLAPLNLRLTPSELIWQLDHLNAKLLIYGDETAEQERSIRDTVPATLNVEDLLHKPARSSRPVAFQLERTQAIIFTSGTTGKPKGAMLSFANHFWSAVASAFRLSLHDGDRWLSCLPLYHVGGLAVLFRSCLYGTTVVLHERFDAQAVSRSLDNEAITMVSLVPTMLSRLMAERTDRLWPATVRAVLLGGAAAGANLIDRCLEQKVPLYVTYGLTEASSQVATMPPAGVRQKPGSVGKALMFSRVAIIDDDGGALPAGKIGEIVVSGPIIMQGYVNEPNTVGAIDRLSTGDLGYLDEDGDLWLVQRRNDLIVSGGENIYPVEIESVLREHPQVEDACVVGLSDDEWGQVAGAAILLGTGGDVTCDNLHSFCRQHLAGYKIPKQWRILSDFPLTASGKIHRQAIAEFFAPSAAKGKGVEI